MARPGVTYTEVAEAAAHLIGQGKNPTIEQIRLLLGTGSSTTIANHIKQWREQQQNTTLLAAKENIPQELIEMMKGLWERVVNISHDKVTEIEKGHENTVADLQLELQKYKSNNQRWQKLFNRWNHLKDRLMSDKLALEQYSQSLEQTNASIQIKVDAQAVNLSEKQAHIDELQRLHQQAQSNLEQYRQSVKEQHQIDQQNAINEKNMLQIEISSQKDQIATTNEKLSLLQNQFIHLQHEHDLQLKQTKQLALQVSQLTLTLSESQTARERDQAMAQNWQEQYHQINKELNAKTSQFIEYVAEIKSLSQQLVENKQHINDLTEQNKKLEQEKWEWTRYKDKLERNIMEKA